MRNTRIYNVQFRFVRRKAQAIWFLEVFCDYGCFAGLRVESVDPGRQFVIRLMAFIIHQNSVTRIGEPDRSIRPDHHVVGRIQAVAIKMINKDRNRPIVFCASYPAGAVLAGDQAAFTIPCIAVGIVRRGSEHADLRCFFRPAQQPVVRNITPDQTAHISEPDRTFRPACPGV